MNTGTEMAAASGSPSGAGPSAVSKPKRNDLSLKLKYEVIKTVERERKIGIRKLAELFSCGKTQISTILKDKEKIVELYEGQNASAQKCHKRTRESKFLDLNETLHAWFCLAVSKNVYPDGRILKEKALEIAGQLGCEEFKASNGWLDRWKKRYNVRQMKVSGESGDVSGATVDSWKERLPDILQGYSAKDILNLDETGCFWRALPDKGFNQRTKACKGGKQSKQRITVTFIVNAVGASEAKPIVIWKSEKPRCFKNVKKSQLPVQYFSQKKAWMTGDILDQVLSKLNRTLRVSGRSVLLLMDNAGCHPEELQHKYTNIKIVFLPANTTSVLQPLNLGIIKNFKLWYRKLLFRHVLAKIEECTTASQVTKSLTILHAIRWVAEAWKQVTSDTIKKCFRKAGILTKSFQVVQPLRISEENDPFLDIDHGENDDERTEGGDQELDELISNLTDKDDACDMLDLISAEDDVPVCAEFADDTWDEEFMSELGPVNKLMCPDDASDEDSDGDTMEEPAPHLKSLGEAISCLEDVCNFLEKRGYTKEANSSNSLLDDLSRLHCASLTKQTSITDYFNDSTTLM